MAVLNFVDRLRGTKPCPDVSYTNRRCGAMLDSAGYGSGRSARKGRKSRLNYLTEYKVV
jgi:hypothetical protein